MKKLLRLYALPALLCALSLPAFCDTVPKDRLNFDWVKFPSLTVHSSPKTLDNYVQFFQQRGFAVVSRQQKFSKAGRLVSFHFRAVRPPEDPSPGNTGKSVEFTWTPQSGSASFDFGSRIYRTGPNSRPLKPLRPATPAVPAQPGT